MNPPEWHYEQAEELIARAAECPVASISRTLTAQAQVHATLATCRANTPLIETFRPTGGRV